MDLVPHYRVQEACVASGDTDSCVTGETLNGTGLGGCDAVRTVPDMDGDGLLDVEEATLGSNARTPGSDRDGFGAEEVLLLGADPLNAHDPTPSQTRRGRGRRRR